MKVTNIPRKVNQREILMRKSLVLGIATLSMLLFVAAVYNPASATTYAVGVKVGDTADYNVALTSSANATRMHVFVYGIVGTTVTLNYSYTLKNGTTLKPLQISGDVATSSGLLLLFLLAKNLTKNDPIGSGSVFKINDTGTMEVAGATRTVNHFNITGFGIIGNIWWDKDTGILVKSAIGIIFVGWWNTTLTATSLWSAGLFGMSTTTLLLIGVVAIVVIALVVVLVRRRR